VVSQNPKLFGHAYELVELAVPSFAVIEPAFRMNVRESFSPGLIEQPVWDDGLMRTVNCDPIRFFIWDQTSP